MSLKPHFLFSSAACGFKKTKKDDLALIYSTAPCTYSGVFTTNKVHAACIDENKNLLKRRKQVRAVVVNSGNANACTGRRGVLAVKKTRQIAARLLKIKEDEVLVASTGVIGIPLDIKKMKKGLEDAVPKLSSKNLRKAARAILTTDRFVKVTSKSTKDFNLIGFAKGAGMIHPRVATMLCFLLTDLKIPQTLLQAVLKQSCDDSFNTISVDGDMSTNDMVILLSNNQSKGKVKGKKDQLFVAFQKALDEVCFKLAREIVRDGEGAKKLIAVHVVGAETSNDAKEIARQIASSTLFKCAVFGSDPNWGRIAARIGSTSVKVNQNKIDILLNNTQVYKGGNPVNFNRQKLNKQMRRSKEIKVIVNLKSGNKSGSALGCDLSYDYIKLNSLYFT